jgi:aspartate racemase
VSLRGFRIELGEVEATLCLHPSVNEAVVVAREDRPGDQRLVAYVVAAAAESVAATGVLRAFLQEKLPDYMIPSAFVSMDALPLTANRKVDRRALPAPEKVGQELSENFIAPRNEVELRLTKIWESVLDTRPIGVTNNFFDLGGHSMLALRLFAQIQKIFKKELPIVTLFKAPTIEKLANILAQKQCSYPSSSLVAIQPAGSNRPFFCIHGCGGDILNYYDLAHHLPPEQPFYALRAQGLDAGQAPHTRVEEMVEYYIKEIQTIQPEGPYFLGAGGGGGKIAFEMAQQFMARGQKVAFLALIDTAPPRMNSSDLNPIRYRKSPSWFLRHLVYHVKHRQLSQALKRNFFNRVLKRWRMFHRYIPSQIRRIQRVRDTQMRALWNYKPEVYPGRITYFLREEFSNNPPARIGSWDELADGGLDVRIVPGDRNFGGHGNIFRKPHVRVLAEQLRVCLDKAQAESQEL